MSEPSVYCTSCKTYKRPDAIYRRNKRKLAPDKTSATGYCYACKRIAGREAHARLLQDPERVAARKARMHRTYLARYAALTPEQKLAIYARRRATMNREKDRERGRRYRERHRAELTAKHVEEMKQARRDPERRPHILERDRRYRQRRKWRRFAARMGVEQP